MTTARLTLVESKDPPPKVICEVPGWVLVKDGGYRWVRRAP